jgi:DNA polymerase-3 subunit delta
MPLKPEQLASALDGTLAPLYLLAGEEPLLVADAADAVRAAARKAGFSERVVYEVERGFDWSVLRGEAASLSLFAERRLLELRLGSGKLGEDASAALCDYASAPPDDVLLLLTGDAFDKRVRSSAWFGACERAGVAMYAWQLEAAALPRWLIARAAARGLGLDAAGAGVLAELTEGNLLAAAQEVDKLALLSEPGATLDRDGVLQAVGDSARYAVRDLADAALAGDRPRLTRAIAHLKDAGETPILALWQLTQDLQRLCDGTTGGLLAASAGTGGGGGSRQQGCRRGGRRLAAADGAGAAPGWAGRVGCRQPSALRRGPAHARDGARSNLKE